MVFAASALAQPVRPARIAYLTGYSAEVDKPLLAAFRQGLRELGYREGSDVRIDVRHGGAAPARIEALAAELAATRPDLYVVGTAGAAAAVRRVAGSAPIVMANVQDPVTSGFVSSLARPGGNMTGMSDFHAASVTKRLELMKEAAPSLRIVGVLWNRNSATNASQLKDLERAAPGLKLQLLSLPVAEPKDIDGALQRLQSERDAGLIMLGDYVLTTRMDVIARAALESRIPAAYTLRGFVAAGGLMAYGTDFADLYRRSASFVDRILKGAKPGDLAIELPTKFELFLNARTAKALGLELPRSLLLRADQVIQ